MALLPAVRPPAPAPPASVTPPPAPAPSGSRPRRPARHVAAAAALTALLVLALVVGGGRPVAPAAGLPDPGLVTAWGRPVVDLLVRVLAVLTVGQLVFAVLLVPTAPTAAGREGPGPGARRALRGSAWAALGWFGAEVAALLLTASSLYGVPVTRLSGQGVLALLTTLPVGRASLWAGLLLLAVALGSALLARTASRPAPAGVLLLLASLGAVVVPVVLAGHSASADDHVPAVVALSVHVVTASLWVGGLVGLLLHGRGRPDVVTAVRRFSALALVCVGLLVVSGVVAALLVAGAPSWSWWGEGWVRLLLAKTVLLVALTAMGAWHRRRTLPALAAGRPRAFARLGVVEVAVMAATLAVSVALAASPSPSAVDGEVPASTGSTATGGAEAADRPAEGPDGTADGTADGAQESDAAAPPAPAPVEDMSGHDHGDLSVSVLVDAERFHVAEPVRPSQPVTVYNSSDAAATITALDGSFDVDVPARTFITFPAPAGPGDHPFVSRVAGEDVPGFADVLRVRDDG
ncbi:copper resistance D family protein [Jannaschia sp. R86511]|uniref:copper resistance D family protein n=1 Tax=Jannaschia sp. R86511 TaxID=3093853 RepID=UPI0036D29E8E